MAPLPRRAKIWPTATDRCSPPPIFGSPIVCDFENGTSSVLIFISHLSDHCQHDRQFSINQYQTFIRQTTSSINGAFTLVRVCECECECECHLGGFASFKNAFWGENSRNFRSERLFYVWTINYPSEGRKSVRTKKSGQIGAFWGIFVWTVKLQLNI